MKKNRFWSYITLASVALVVAAVAALWVLPAGAGHTDPVKGVLEVAPGVVSPDDANVALASRLIKITVTDPNMNKPLFVGTGPDAQTATFDQVGGADAGAGERVAVSINTVGTFIATLTANPIVGVEDDDFTPLADRNDDDVITVADLEIVIPAAGTSDIVAGDIQVIGIFNAERGLVTFQVNRDGLNGEVFDLRYATAGRELSRDTQTFTETLAVPAPGAIVNGESVTLTLNNTLLDTDVSGAVNSGDVTESSGAAVNVGGLSADSTKVTLIATANIATPAVFVLEYRGSEVVTLRTVDTAGDFTLALNNVVLTAAGGVPPATGDLVVTGDAAVLAIAADNTSVMFNRGTLVTGDSFTVAYNNRQTFAAVADPGVFNGEAFTLDLNMDWLPLQDSTGDGLVSPEDITVSIALRTAANLPPVTSIRTVGNFAVSPSPNGFAASNTIDLVGSGDQLAAGTEIKVTYVGLADLVTVRGDFTPIAGISLRLRETGPDTGVFEGFVAAVAGTSSGDDSDNSNLNPEGTGDGANTAHLAVQDGGAISVLYRDRSPARPIKATVQVEAQGPTFAGLNPASGDTINDLGAVLTAQAQDIGAAGVNPATLEANNPGLATSVVLIITIDGIDQGTQIVTGDIDVNETFAGSGVFTIEFPLDKLPTIADEKTAGSEVEHDITWEIRVKDNAGNQGTTGVVPLKLINRRPVLANVFIGDNWDPSVTDDPLTDEDERLRGSRAGLAGAALRTSIRVVFDLPMQGASFQPEDFRITGADGISFQPSSVAALRCFARERVPDGARA